jgi:hypothetical protein
MKNYGAWVCGLKFGVMQSKYGEARKNNSVWMCSLHFITTQYELGGTSIILVHAMCALSISK